MNHDRLADAGLTAAGATPIALTFIDELNKYLQAGSLIVAIVSGICAAVYYIRKGKK